MAKNPNNRDGGFLDRPAAGTRAIVKSATGSTRVTGLSTIEHADSPTTPATNYLPATDKGPPPRR